METEPGLLVVRIGALLTLVAFLPLTGSSFYRFRREQRRLELERIFSKLNIDANYKKIHTANITGWHFMLSAGFATLIAAMGLAVLLLGHDFGIAEAPSILLGGARIIGITDNQPTAELIKYQTGALLVFGMAFLGAYLWGLQMIVRRYTLNDLVPAAYYHFGVRMIFSAAIAMLVYHSLDGGADFDGGGDFDGAVAGPALLPALAFIVGMFPQRGLHWLNQRLSFLIPKAKSAARDLPLDMVEGISRYDRLRLEELGVESCYDLASADFIPLLLKTPYGARELIDWLLQAKLCVHFGAGVKSLRDNGIRQITDFEMLDDEALQSLSDVSGQSMFALRQARSAVLTDANIERLRAAAALVSEYWDREDPSQPAPVRSTDTPDEDRGPVETD